MDLREGYQLDVQELLRRCFDRIRVFASSPEELGSIQNEHLKTDYVKFITISKYSLNAAFILFS